MDAMPHPPERSSLGFLLLSAVLLMANALGSFACEANEPGERAALATFGEALFFDTALSDDGRIACASCHRPELAFTDGSDASTGVHGRRGSRNAPSLLGLGEVTEFFWEGRTSNRVAAMTDAFFNPREMGLSGPDELFERISASKRHAPLLLALPEPMQALDLALIARAIDAFLEAQPRRPSPFDRFKAGDSDALTEQARRGLSVFEGKGRCVDCHSLDGQPPALTDHGFHHTGVGFHGIAPQLPQLMQRYRERLETASAGSIIIGDSDIAELGRYLATGKTADIGAFRTPSLRNVARTAPYMHNGSIATLSEALDREVYYRSVTSGHPVSLTLQEREDLLAFLESLSDGE